MLVAGIQLLILYPKTTLALSTRPIAILSTIKVVALKTRGAATLKTAIVNAVVTHLVVRTNRFSRSSLYILFSHDC